MPTDTRQLRSVIVLSVVGLALSLAGLIVLLTGCSGGQAEAAAREPNPKAGVEISHWKQTGLLGTRLYGLIVQQEGERISAALYELEDEEGLVIREKESQGKFFPDKQSILFPLYKPAGVTAEDWVAQGGPQLVVPWTPNAATLSGTLKDPSRTNLYTFARLPPPTPTTNGLGVATIGH